MAQSSERPRRTTPLLRWAALIGLFLAFIAVIGLTSYIPWFDRLTRDHSDEMKEAIDAYLQVRSQRDLQGDDRKWACFRVALARPYRECQREEPLDASTVSAVRVTSYSPQCAIVIAQVDAAGSKEPVVYELLYDRGRWKVAFSKYGRHLVLARQERAYFWEAHPDLPLECVIVELD